MKTIHKYELRLNLSDNVLQIPSNAEILKVDEQHGVYCLWAIVDTDEISMDDIVYYGTGHKLPIHMSIAEDIHKTHTYLDTLQFHNGELVFHFFIQH